MTPKFIIQDWASNVCFNGQEFESFEDGWEFLYERFADLSDADLEEELGEYYVVPAKTRETRYLEPVITFMLPERGES